MSNIWYSNVVYDVNFTMTVQNCNGKLNAAASQVHALNGPNTYALHVVPACCFHGMAL